MLFADPRVQEVTAPIMFRVLLTILAGLPMLMPPGMCICQFVPCGRASADETRLPVPTDGAVTVAVDSGPSCGCGHRRSQSQQAKQKPGKPGGLENIPVDHSAPNPLPGQHAPGCPAALTAATEKVALPTSQLQTLLVLALDFVGSAPVSSEMDGPSERVTIRPHSPPLFLSYCTLLI
jgi:hypothetical protein